MFRSIRYLRYDYFNSENLHCHTYWLEDSDFVGEIAGSSEIINRYGMQSHTAFVIAALIEYRKRNLPVAKNLAALYLYFKKGGSYVDNWFETDRKLISKYCPTIRYTEKYYSCVLNQFKMLTYGDRKI